MSGFYNEMVMRMGLSVEQTVGVKITVCDMCGATVEGHNGLLSYTPDEIVLRIKRKKLIVRGKDMLILEITKEEAFIKGRLCSFEVENV